MFSQFRLVCTAWNASWTFHAALLHFASFEKIFIIFLLILLWHSALSPFSTFRCKASHLESSNVIFNFKELTNKHFNWMKESWFWRLVENRLNHRGPKQKSLVLDRVKYIRYPVDSQGRTPGKVRRLQSVCSRHDFFVSILTFYRLTGIKYFTLSNANDFIR